MEQRILILKVEIVQFRVVNRLGRPVYHQTKGGPCQDVNHVVASRDELEKKEICLKLEE